MLTFDEIEHFDERKSSYLRDEPTVPAAPRRPRPAVAPRPRAARRKSVAKPSPALETLVLAPPAPVAEVMVSDQSIAATVPLAVSEAAALLGATIPAGPAALAPAPVPVPVPVEPDAAIARASAAASAAPPASESLAPEALPAPGAACDPQPVAGVACAAQAPAGRNWWQRLRQGVRRLLRRAAA
ncbi:MAG: hypothetical protein JNM32_04520 [Dechloromonas sp.]|nr:hypothetical protein [Dechloromonas sp.]